jgi:hypothetical protein
MLAQSSRALACSVFYLETHFGTAADSNRESAR